MPELLENDLIVVSDRHLVPVNLFDGGTATVELNELAEFIDENRQNIKFSKSRRRRKPLGFPEIQQ
jgi:hypothetical protein